MQRPFGTNAFDQSWPTRSSAEGRQSTIAASCVRDGATGDVIVKLVSRADAAVRASVDVPACGNVGGRATRAVLAGDPDAANGFGQPAAIEVPSPSLAIARVSKSP